jgi:hypothetical protein
VKNVYSGITNVSPAEAPARRPVRRSPADHHNSGHPRTGASDRASAHHENPGFENKTNSFADTLVLRRRELGRILASAERILMPSFPTNIQVIKLSRKKPEAGDVFALRLPDQPTCSAGLSKPTSLIRRARPCPGPS